MSLANRCKVHKYRRYSKNSRFRNDIYYCINCPSYKRVDMIIGSHTTCWKCGNEFTMTDKTLQLKPQCPVCTGLKSIKDKDINVKELVNKLMEKL